MPGAGVAAELTYSEEADGDDQVRCCEVCKPLDDVFGLCVASRECGGGGGVDGRFGDDAGWGGVEAGAYAAGEGEGFGAAGMG